MEIDKIDIHELLPQREPFVMVGRMVYFDMGRCATRTRIAPGNLFVEKGRFTPSGISDNLAQTRAARIGYTNKYILKKGIQLGFIGAIRNMNLYRSPEAGEEIETEIVTIEEVLGMTLVSAKVTAGEETIAEAEIKIALSDKESKGEE